MLVTNELDLFNVANWSVLAQLNRSSSSCWLQIRGFPTIKIFRKGEEPEDYQGGRSRGDIIARALDLFADNAPPPELLEVSELLDSPSSALHRRI